MRLQKIGLPLLLAAIVCLTSCAVAEKDTPDVLYGWQLQRQGLGYYDWGYTYSLPEEAATDRVEELTYFTMDHYWGAEAQWGYNANDLNGAYTRIDYIPWQRADMVKNNSNLQLTAQTGSGPYGRFYVSQVSVPLMYLQHIPKSQLQHKPNAVIRVKGHGYTQQEMADYLLFANERAYVYDLTPFFIDDWDNYLQKFCDDHQAELSPEAIAGVEQAHAFLLAHRQEIIQPAAPREITWQQISQADSVKLSERNRHASSDDPVLFGYGDCAGFAMLLPQTLDEIVFPGRLAYEEAPGDWDVGYAVGIENALCGEADMLWCGRLPIFCWQTFYKSDLALPEARIQVGETLYAPQELAAYQLSESATTILYDFTPLVLYTDWEDYLAEGVKEKRIKAEDAAWIEDLHHMLQEKRAELFVPCVQIVPEE